MCFQPQPSQHSLTFVWITLGAESLSKMACVYHLGDAMLALLPL